MIVIKDVECRESKLSSLNIYKVYFPGIVDGRVFTLKLIVRYKLNNLKDKKLLQKIIK